MATNFFDENHHQTKPDEVAIDYSKLDAVKTEQDLIYRLFKVSIVYGNAVKPTKTTPINQLTQWLTLIGDTNDRSDAKVNRICLKN